MAELSDPRLGTLLEGRYRLDQRLAAGGMGVVYKGELVAIAKPVAIKFLHDAFAAIPDLVKRFQREALTMSRLAHPHLVSVVDSGLAGGVPFLVMDFVSGRSLADVLADGALPAPRAVGLARQILAGVRHAHASGVVHRDLKPDNILLLADVEGDFAKILDFGLAKVLQGSGESATQLTNTGFALGTPGYMSPEQARGTESDERSDLYAVGVVLYHMLTGRKPFIADSPLAVLRMHMDDTPAPPTAVAPRCCSPELERVVLRAMAKEPSARWQSAAEFAKALAATPEASVGDAPPAVEDGSAPRRLDGRRRGWLARAALLAMVAVAVTMAWSRLSRHEQQKVRRGLGDAVKMAEGAFEPRPTADGPAAKSGAARSTPTAPKPALPSSSKTKEPALAAPPPGIPAAADPVAAHSSATGAAASGAPAATPPSRTSAPAAPLAAAPTVASATPAMGSQTPAAAGNRAAAESAIPKGAPATPASPAGAAAAAAAAAAATDEDDEEDESTPEEPVAPRDTPGAKLEEVSRAQPPPAVAATTSSSPEPARAATPAKARPPTARDAAHLIANGRFDEAIQILYAVRRHAPHSAEVALLLGHAYFHKLWRTDGLREYDAAIKLSPSLRWDRPLIRNSVGALEDPTYRLARAVIKTRIGAAALPEVRHAARAAKSPKVQKRAARLAQQLARGGSRRR